MNAPGGNRIESPQQTVQRTRASSLTRSQANPQILVAARAGRQPFNQSAQVEPRAPGYHRNMPARCNLVQNRTPDTRIIARREYLIRVERVYQMVGDSAALALRRFGRPDIEVTKDLNGIAIDNFTRETLGDSECQIALSGAGRSGYSYERTGLS